MNSGEQAGKQKVKLVFNPNAGAVRKYKVGLSGVVSELRKLNIEPDICILRPECNLALELKTALSEGVQTFAVCGGDGTVSAVCDVLAGTEARIAILPAGTRNNSAKSLKIPTELAQSAALIRGGRVMQIDAGSVFCGGSISHFLEIVSVGLVAAVNDSGDALQHGRIASIGEFLSDFAACPPADISITLDNEKTVKDNGFVALVTNMPYAGFHYQFGDERCNRDGLLDVLFFSDLSKLELLKYIAGGIYPGKPEDPRIRHFRAKQVDIDTQPPMPVTADGRTVGRGKIHIEMRQKALRFITGG